MFKKSPIAVALLAASSLIIAGGCAATDAGKAPAAKAPEAKPAVAAPAPAAKVDYTKMTPAQLAEYLIFESGSYDLKQPTQEGTTGRDRLVQDEIQKLCSVGKGQVPSDAALEKVRALATASIKYPEGGIKLGDWKKGRVLAWSGFGYRTAHNPDNHAKREAGGNCYNCHQLATDRTGGNIGPVLTNYGKDRGTSPEILKYTYDVIYNPHAYFACTNMPRMGANGVLSPQQISDIMAYLFDPNSPVNK
ncbi:MAG: sulfur oxidation c-type cytochrome SoxX [Pseudomonadota bacterium]